ncbi:MAG: cytochrome c biosis factor [Actinomycetia bacterium]|nr:cytochrome c biosis factor [Actinomycetes bacterium]
MSLNASLGTAAVTAGLAASVLGMGTLAVGLRRRDEKLLRTGRVYAAIALAGAFGAFVVMERALLGHDFSLKYVAQHGNRAVPVLYTFASLWGALEGSIILWTLVLCGYMVAVLVRFRARAVDPLVAWATLTMLGVSTFFFALMLGPANPFKAVAGAIPTNGPGPNPLLQDHPLMAIHPPFLYLGYVGFTVPFAFCVAALVTGRVGEGWLAATRRWTLVSWGFLTIGIVLGAWWSYEVLGWGGFWAWDPVENASFLPWLTGTAYIHSVMVQERRGMLRVWNLSLLLATFSLTILGTFLTRSGVLDSVHSFSESPIGPWLLTFFGIIVTVSLGLIAWRGDRLRSPGRIDSPLSREGAFLLNNVLFAAFAFVVLLGTVFPLIYEALKGDVITVQRPYFDRMTMPIGLALLFLMAIAPVLPWRKASTELLRHRLLWPAWGGAVAIIVAVVVGARGLSPLLAFGLGGFAAGAAGRQLVLAARAARRSGSSLLGAVVGRANGGMVVHLGVIIVAVAFTSATSFSHATSVRMNPGDTKHVVGQTITYLGSGTEKTARKTTVSARVRVNGGRVFAPAISEYPNGNGTVPTPSVDVGLRRDIYLTLDEAPRANGSAVIGIVVEPLVSWLWLGGLLMAIGTALAIVPGRRRNPIAPVSEPPRPEVPDTELVDA